ncbi:MAG: hypothetical protein AAF733_06930 [Verrucomicrobiota bacterium]
MKSFSLFSRNTLIRPGTSLSTLALSLLCFLGIQQNCEARLGESYRQCVKFYGEPTGTIEVPGLIENGVRFHRGEFSITCGFENNLCVTVLVMHLSPESPVQQAISREDIDLFLNDNFGHTSWVYTYLGTARNEWRTYDLEFPRNYVASYSYALKMLMMSIEQG